VSDDTRTTPKDVIALPAAADLPARPRVNGRYRMVGELGAGRLGTVSLAEDEVTGSRVALRLLPQATTGRARAAAMIERMARAIVPASKAHPALVHVLDFGRAENGTTFIATEFVEGRRLSDVLAAGTSLHVARTLDMALDLGGAVETFHNMGIVHGALRSRNVMLLEDGRVKLMDLELAAFRDGPATGATGSLPPLESLAPEQIRQGPVSEKTDIYAFAIIVFEMLCGVPPFRGTTREAVLAAQSATPPPWVRERRRVVPVSVQRIITDALSEQPERRPFMPELLNALVVKPRAPATRRATAIVSGTALAALMAVPVAWGIAALRSSPAPNAVYRVLPTVSEPVPMRLPAASPAPLETPPSPAPDRATPAAVSPVTRATPPSMPSSPSHAIRTVPREPTPRAPAEAAAARPASPSDEGYDPGAVIDWLLESARRGK
jgi:serine/threonine-protein kinase